MFIVLGRGVEILQRQRRRGNIVHGPAIVLRTYLRLQMLEQNLHHRLMQILVGRAIFIFEGIDDVEKEQTFAFALEFVLGRVLLNVEIRMYVDDTRLFTY